MTGLASYFMARLYSIELAGRRLFVVASEWQEERRSKESSTASCMLAVVKSHVLVYATANLTTNSQMLMHAKLMLLALAC